MRMVEELRKCWDQARSGFAIVPFPGGPVRIACKPGLAV